MQYLLVSFCLRVIAVPDHFHSHERERHMQREDRQRNQCLGCRPVDRPIGEDLAGSDLVSIAQP